MSERKLWAALLAVWFFYATPAVADMAEDAENLYDEVFYNIAIEQAKFIASDTDRIMEAKTQNKPLPDNCIFASARTKWILGEMQFLREISHNFEMARELSHKHSYSLEDENTPSLLLNSADSLKADNCLKEADYAYREVIKRYPKLIHQAARQWAQNGIDDIRAKKK